MAHSHVNAMAARNVARKEKDPNAEQCVFIAFDPPEKKDLPQVILCSKTLLAKGMGVKSSLVFSSKKVGSSMMMYRHPAAGLPHDVSCRPPLSATGKDELEDSVGGAWKRYYRTARPEKMQLKLGSLLRMWKRDRSCGAVLSSRRVNKAVRLDAFAKRQKKKSDRARQTLEARRDRLRKAEASSTSESSSSSSSSSSSHS